MGIRHACLHNETGYRLRTELKAGRPFNRFVMGLAGHLERSQLTHTEKLDL